MKKYYLICLCFLVFLPKSYAQKFRQLSLITPGAYIFSYNNYHFREPFKFNILFLPTTINYFSYNESKRRGFIVNAGIYHFQYHEPYFVDTNNFPNLIVNSGLQLSLSYTWRIKSWAGADLYFNAGLTSKFAHSDINLFLYNHGGWQELIYDDHAEQQIGGLAVNAGLSFIKPIYKRLNFISNVRTINYLVGTKYQNHSLWFDNGFGLRLGSDSYYFHKR